MNGRSTSIPRQGCVERASHGRTGEILQKDREDQEGCRNGSEKAPHLACGPVLVARGGRQARWAFGHLFEAATPLGRGGVEGRARAAKPQKRQKRDCCAGSESLGNLGDDTSAQAAAGACSPHRPSSFGRLGWFGGSHHPRPLPGRPGPSARCTSMSAPMTCCSTLSLSRCRVPADAPWPPARTVLAAESAESSE
jgi:hypothetical protein